MVSFAYDNLDMINGLKRRGKAIISGDFDRMEKQEMRLASMIKKKYN
jgi:hypothetical protein